MTDMAAEMDLLLSSVGKGSRNDSAMGVGRDSTDAGDAEPERRKKVRGADGQAHGAAGASASAPA